MRKIIFLFSMVALFTLMSNSGCSSRPETADEQLANQTELAMKEANREAGYPAIVNFQEKKVMKYIYELRDQENLVCHAYFFNELKISFKSSLEYTLPTRFSYKGNVFALIIFISSGVILTSSTP